MIPIQSVVQIFSSRGGFTQRKGLYFPLQTGKNCSDTTDEDGRIAPRSGLAAKHGIDVGAGVIDADYRGPLKVLLFNFGEQDFLIKEGERIAQLVLERVRPSFFVLCFSFFFLSFVLSSVGFTGTVTFSYPKIIMLLPV